ncbi:hypothetical protein TL16_g01846 [Triparma laevis f. inornata]|uniref:GOLD domain-containing protein n=1 Tax=Triparma laevis f. inornata TaxID=1714386 RepID=A0A9W7DU82_9STRA|nr:hypothetical protein TL16_g01846 [Triparma laevis f. inornata]
MKIDGPITENWGDSVKDIIKSEKTLPGASGSSARKLPKNSKYEVILKESVDMSAIADVEDAMSESRIRKGAADDLDSTYLYSFAAKFKGTYRVCAVNDVSPWTSKTVELDLRVKREKEQLDPNGHVMEREDFDENVADPTLATSKHSKDMLKTLSGLKHKMDSMDKKQKTERHRLELHSGLNEKSHSRMVIGALFETVLFIGLMGGQIWILKYWFEGRGLPQYGGGGYGGYGGGGGSEWGV